MEIKRAQIIKGRWMNERGTETILRRERGKQLKRKDKRRMLRGEKV